MSEESLREWVCQHIDAPEHRPLDMHTGFRDGLALLYLFKNLTRGQEMEGEAAIHTNLETSGKNYQTHCLENIDIVLKNFARVGGLVIACSPMDIFQGNERQICTLIWKLILRFDFPASTREDLARWANNNSSNSNNNNNNGGDTEAANLLDRLRLTETSHVNNTTDQCSDDGGDDDADSNDSIDPNDPVDDHDVVYFPPEMEPSAPALTDIDPMSITSTNTAAYYNYPYPPPSAAAAAAAYSSYAYPPYPFPYGYNPQPQPPYMQPASYHQPYPYPSPYPSYSYPPPQPPYASTYPTPYWGQRQ